MQTQTHLSNIHFIRPSGKQGIDCEKQFLTKILAGAPQAPLSICINSASIRILDESNSCVSELLHNEMQLWANFLGTRVINTFELIHPSHCFEPYELTSLIHCVSTSFSLHPIARRQHRAVCSINEISGENLALLKGLGFTQIQLQVPHLSHLTTQEFQTYCKQIEDYHFDFFGIQLEHTDCLDEMAPKIREFIKQIRPDYIFIGTHSLNMSLSFDDKHSARIIVDERDLGSCDTICLGPESISTINGHRLQHLCAPEKYIQSIIRGRLPLHVKPKPL